MRRSIFRYVWPIHDVDQTQAELRIDAETDLPDILFDARVQPAGEPVWRIASQDDGTAWLVLDLPVVPWTDPVRHRARRATVSSGAR
jgi:hypothetical protein